MIKLPTDPKQRQQLFIASGVIAVLIIGAIIYYGNESLVAPKDAWRQETADFTKKRTDAEREIKQMQSNHDKSLQVLARVREESDKYFLKPSLKMYFVPAKNEILAVALKAGIPVDILDGGMAEIYPSGSSLAGAAVSKAYVLRVSTSCGVNELVRLFKALEEFNPCLTFTAISISGQAAVDPKKHGVAFDLQWPVWKDEAAKARFESMVKNAEAQAGAGSNAK